MPDLKRTTQGLECCGKGNMCRSHCPYDGPENDIKNCTSQLARDALSLLNTQRERIKELEELLYKGGCDGLNACSVMSCPYYNASHVRIEETKAAIIVGLQTENEKLQAKIRELETTRDPRVMTICEIQSFDGAVYVDEPKNPVCLKMLYCYEVGQRTYGHGYTFVDSDGDKVFYSAQGFGTKWRCWTSRPTDEQREAVKWG